MAASPKDKFDAAVRVIRGLPKNGSFQPSHELLLKFYSYFKQATEGPCTIPKPGFWDVVNRKKWEAWSSLGKMAKEEAMLQYVDELKKVSIHVRETCYPPEIVETMPQTKDVNDFLEKLDNFYEIVEDSENHNMIKASGYLQNGDLATNGKGDLEDTENDIEEKQRMDDSYNIAHLLKQDIQRSREGIGIIRTEGFNGYGISDTLNGTNGSRASGEEEDEEYSQEDDDEDVKVEEERENEGGINEERTREQEDATGLSVSHSASDSETENEEFCDTSDEPTEISKTVQERLQKTHDHRLSGVPTSTPVNGKTVHFNSTPGRDAVSKMSDSLEVNLSQEESFVSSRLNADIQVRRGEEDEPRRRGRGSQAMSSGGARDSHEGRGTSSEDAGGSGDTRRALFSGSGGGGGSRRPDSSSDVVVADLNEQVVVTLLRLQHDMSGVLNRLNSLETLVKENREARKARPAKGWWPLPDLSASSALFVVVWPLVVHFLITYVCKRRRKLHR